MGVTGADDVPRRRGGGLRALILRGGAFRALRLEPRAVQERWVWPGGCQLGVRRQREDRERLALQEPRLDQRGMGDNSYGMSVL